MTATNYASYTRDTREILKGLAHRGRLSSAAQILGAGPTDRLLDYGCGDGHLLTYFQGIIGDEDLCGYDPDSGLLAQRSQTLENVDLRPDIHALINDKRHLFTRIACFEVCEHLSPSAMSDAFSNIQALAAPGAIVVFGVPVESGPSGFIKNLYRVAKGGRQRATLPKAFRSLFGVKIKREYVSDQWTHSHIGFRWRQFQEDLELNGFVIKKRTYLPVPQLGPLLNNEVYFVCEVADSVKFTHQV
ncbi:methyltransferase domain-containing protein [Mesorhizobium sp. M0768]|uniref:class I SAM-dependent methyltransferase n=1 Tax=Mesorhizobium sp. M0768 TaxID=2956996 RepID=UPI00333D5D35